MSSPAHLVIQCISPALDLMGIANNRQQSTQTKGCGLVPDYLLGLRHARTNAEQELLIIVA